MAERPQCTVCLCLLCGIPASGKTTLASRIKELCECAEKLGPVLFLPLHYDLLIPTQLETCLIMQTAEQGGLHWKRKRNEVLSFVDCLLSKISVFSKCCWRDHYEKILHCTQSHFSSETSTWQVENILGLTAPSDSDCVLWENFLQAVNNCVSRYLNGRQDLVLNEETEALWLILVDDNLQYSSMRYDYYQLAKKYETGFCTVCVTCPLEVALRRNGAREEDRVNDHVIVQMYERLEVPGQSKRSWEKYHCIIEGTASGQLDCVLGTIHKAVLDPVRPQPEEDTEGQAISRYICSTNALHQADQILRRCVSSYMANARGMSQDLKSLSQALAKERSRILDELRRGDITLPFFLDDKSVSDASRRTDSVFFTFLQQLFKLRTNDL